MRAALQRLARAGPARRGRSGSACPCSRRAILTMASLMRADVRAAGRAPCVSSPCAAAPSAGNSQLARWAAKTAPACRRRACHEALDRLFVEITMSAGAGPRSRRVRKAGRGGRTRRRRGRDCPRRRAGFLDLGRRFFREGGAQVVAADAMLRQPAGRAWRSTRAGEVGHAACGSIRRSSPQQRRPRSHPTAASTTALEPATDASSESSATELASTLVALERDDDLAEHLPALEPRQAALEIGERRLRCRSPASMPAAILARLSRMLRIEAPNEPKMRYCCWKSCIRLIVGRRPEVEPQVTSRPPRLRQSREPLKVSAPTCSNTTSTPFLAVSLRTTPSKRSVR